MEVGEGSGRGDGMEGSIIIPILQMRRLSEAT